MKFAAARLDLPIPPAIPALVIIPDQRDTDHQTLYAIATAYAHSGIMLSDYAKKNDAFSFVFPAIVCSSFAIELFMKFFLALEKAGNDDANRKRETGHRLQNLWGRINKNHRGLIAGMFRNPSRVPHLNAEELRAELFEKALNEVGESPFVKWRYPYEIANVELMSHGAITEVLDALGFAAEYAMNIERQKIAG